MLELMKSFFRFLVLSCISIVSLCAVADSTADKEDVLVTSEDVTIKDKALEKKLLKAVKENGTLTSTRQVHSYMVAILCEYPTQDMKAKPYCSFRKVKVRSRE